MALLDVMMPGRDGISPTRHIRQAGDLPIVLLTARGRPPTGSAISSSTATA